MLIIRTSLNLILKKVLTPTLLAHFQAAMELYPAIKFTISFGPPHAIRSFFGREFHILTSLPPTDTVLYTRVASRSIPLSCCNQLFINQVSLRYPGAFGVLILSIDISVVVEIRVDTKPNRGFLSKRAIRYSHKWCSRQGEYCSCARV